MPFDIVQGPSSKFDEKVWVKVWVDMLCSVMSRTNRLSAVKVQKEAKPGYHADGLGLYLQVSQAGAKSWIYRYRVGDKLRDMGLGSFYAVSLAQARDKAAKCRSLRAEGLDPIDARKAEKEKARSETLRAITFETCADAYIASHSASWKSAKHAAQWTSTLKTYAYPVFASRSVAQIGQDQVLAVLEPIWQSKPETASRVRGRIESVLDFARVRGYRDGENPARWRGHLDKLLPHRTELAPVEHHSALNHAALPAFMRELRAEQGTAAKALELCILTCTRSGETLGARWSEINLDARFWHIPASRMKARRDHRVPLSGAALNVIGAMQDTRTSDYVFPGKRNGKPLSGMAMLMLLRRMGHADITAHGFRSTFRDWVAEQTSVPNDIAEMALAHVNPNKVEAAYKRSDVFEKRRNLSDAWAGFCVDAVQIANASDTIDAPLS